MKTLFQSLSAFGLGLLAAGTAGAQVAPAPVRAVPAQPVQAAPAQPAAAPAEAGASNNHGQGIDIKRRPGDIPGPIDSFQDIQDSLKMAFMAADQNHDGLISQKEATDAGNMLVGGLFFSADANGDGAVSREEAQAIRERLMSQNPLVRLALQRAKETNPQNAAAGTQALRNIGSILDGNDDNKIQASELRQAVTTGVQGLFSVADTNRDSQLSPNELNAAAYSIARAASQAAFQQADKDNNGQLSKEEFHQSLVQPADAVFNVLDANGDGQLSQQEMNRAGQVIASRVRMFQIPDADNSVDELLRTGQRPGEVAPPANVNASQINNAVDSVKPNANNPR
jgi:Ca2+-binding EF-hand superfamily protein